jgi:glycosyltransferase involved in cell wall biosynthesis
MQYGVREEFLVLCVSAYGENKYQEGVLRAFRRADLKNARLVFIGNEFNDYSERLQRINKLLPASGSPESVLFLEKLTPDAIRAAYQASDLFVLSSKGETQPLVLLSAMACGKPFISTDVGCVSELPGGLVVKNQQEMTAALKSLQGDIARRRSLGRAGSEACRNVYNWESVLDSYETLCAKLTGKPRLNPRLADRN